MSKSAGNVSVVCPQCRAVVLVKHHQIGSSITCPDCLEDFPVQPPANDSAPENSDDLFGGVTEAPEEIFPSEPVPVGSPEAPAGEGMWDSQWDETRDQLDALLRPTKASAHQSKNPATPAASPAKSSSQPRKPSSNRTKGPRTPPPGEPYDFTSPCPLCGTRLESTSEKIGTTRQCPDCHTHFEIREPPKSARRERSSQPTSDDDELQISEEIPLTPVEVPEVPESAIFSLDDFANLPPPDAPAPRVPTPTQVIHETLVKAAQEVEEDEKKQPPLPAKPFQTGVMRFLFHPMAVGRWLILSFFWSVEIGAIQTSIVAAAGGPMAQATSVMLRIFAAVVGSLLVAQTFMSLLAIAQESSQGIDVIEGWPGINVVEWFFESWQMFASLFLVLTPGIVLGQAAYTVSGSFGSFLFFMVVVDAPLLTLVFPVLLLSFLESNYPYSKPIVQSLTAASGHWMTFWMYSAMLVGGACILGWIRYASNSSFLNLIVTAGMMLLAMVYFRMFGRLSWACEDTLTKRDLAQQESE